MFSVQARFSGFRREVRVGFHFLGENLSLHDYTLSVGILGFRVWRVHSCFGMALGVVLNPVVPVSYISWARAAYFDFHSACPAKVVSCLSCCHGTFQDMRSCCRGTFKNMPCLLSWCRVLFRSVASFFTPFGDVGRAQLF